jgi:hypothetical protein
MFHDLILPAGILGLFRLFVYLFYSHAEMFYDQQVELRNHHPVLFKIVGYNTKRLADKSKWIRSYRILLILMSFAFLTCLFVVLSVGRR